MAKTPTKIHAFPVKNFFISMLTKDISLQDCILDLLDNCLDGAARLLMSKKDTPQERRYGGYWAELVMKADSFSISDNCGGLSIDTAANYAFHFGRRPDAPQEAEFAIGLYGIGMKRAFFKIGKRIKMTSSIGTEAFETTLDVEEWAKSVSDWDFELYPQEPPGKAGTEIIITQLNPWVGDEFTDSVFINRLTTTIARDYSFFLQEGFKVKINQNEIRPYDFKLKNGQEFEPVKYRYEENEGEEKPVIVTISAGMADPPSDDELADASEPPLVDYYGWFVSCNNRIVLAGDKTDQTVWGNEHFARWHTQYYGFMGIIDFSSSDPNRLPWDTTKRDLELTNRLYRRAIFKMKQITQEYIDYTNQRKDSLEEAKQKESSTIAVSVKSLPIKSEMKLKLPLIEKKPKVKMATIQYQRPNREVREVATSLGDAGLSNKEVGIRTYEYYVEHEIEE